MLGGAADCFCTSLVKVVEIFPLNRHILNVSENGNSQSNFPFLRMKQHVTDLNLKTLVQMNNQILCLNESF